VDLLQDGALEVLVHAGGGGWCGFRIHDAYKICRYGTAVAALPPTETAVTVIEWTKF
jgi:hypothetical protein